MNKQDVFKVLVLIESVYPKFRLKNETVQIWFAFCGNLDFTLVMKKVCNHIRTNPYPPLITNIITSFDSEEELVAWERRKLSWKDEYKLAK
ncbi:replicative helicase loader/inhibitor [Neobacillus sp. PS3-40]|uniref:replicative helicase loader/inhibitor n=1 Tax=Neobacillus sp. PS3-40 TaxID=3070679 RepID=UPI0027DEDC93|nr:replicative helicase loader/inhibitor [Neobacillus sp. PS3-40]WML44452.1 replicative helicase loader/inhibitor [Neobacillus sp. PS3-40]